MGQRALVPLGGSPTILTLVDLSTFANIAAPVCYVLTLNEVKAAAHRGVNATGTVSH